jgi:chromosomal replication initiation ATPase DnaA
MEAHNDAGGQHGYWTRDAVVAMDNRALAKMAAVHPNLVPPELSSRILNFFREDRQAQELLTHPVFRSESAADVLARLFSALPALSGEVPARDTPTITSEVIKRMVATKFGLTTGDLEGASKVKHTVHARQEAMFLIHEQCPWLSLPQIGKALRKDHTTVLHGIRAHGRRNDLPLSRGLQQLEQAQ